MIRPITSEDVSGLEGLLDHQSVGTNLHSLARIKGQAVSDLLIREIDTLQAFGLSKIMQDRVQPHTLSRKVNRSPSASASLTVKRGGEGGEDVAWLERIGS